jgi:hypothetical protein
LAGDGPLPSPAAHVAAGETFELRWWHDQVNDLQRAAHAAERELARRDERLRALGAKLLEAEQVRGEAVALQGELDAVNRDLAVARYRIDRADRVLADITRSFSWRLTAPLRRAKARLRRP